MGNRAVITTSTAINVQASTDLGVYVHWNGGEKSVTAFFDVLQNERLYKS